VEGASSTAADAKPASTTVLGPRAASVLNALNVRHAIADTKHLQVT